MTDKARMSDKIKLLHKRTSLGVKLIMIAIVVGVVSGVVLDYLQHKQLTAIFRKQLDENLQQLAQKDRAMFDNYIRAQHSAVNIIISQKNFLAYIDNAEWSEPEKIIHVDSPSWLPQPSVQRAFPVARFYLLIDSTGKVREIYRNTNLPIPQALSSPSSLLRQLSHNQTYMTNIEGAPYLISTKKITGAREKSPGSLMLASPIDGEFLFSALGAHQKESIVAIADSQQNLIVASSHADLIPTGAKIGDLKEKYLITGKSFFDYGASDLRINFLSLISRSKYHELGQKIMATGKLQRTFASLVLILSFLIIIFWITGKIKKLTRRVVLFSEENLGTTPQLNRRGDELMVLEESFELFTNEIITAQNKLKQEVKTLSGFLPICASCKKIRDDNGYWNQIEEYIREHSEAEFSHGICPDCKTKLYPELDSAKNQKGL